MYYKKFIYSGAEKSSCVEPKVVNVLAEWSEAATKFLLVVKSKC